jgi:error-prone DNA polymerase
MPDDPPSTPGLPAYAELFCLSNFSFLQGASHAEELVDRAVQLGYAALALTDECSLAGVVRAHAEAKRAGLPLIVGAHFHLVRPDGSRRRCLCCCWRRTATATATSPN